MFHFKKFSIDDSKAAMKIGTDSVLLGAWTPCENEIRILDIGTGSGILALMMAQRNVKIQVDAVEVDPAAAILARQNVELSPWADHIHVFSSSIQEFSVNHTQEYSLIICNPPFFTGSLKAPDKIRSIARHNDTLPVKELLSITAKLLKENGKASFIIPADAFASWKAFASNICLYPSLVTHVKSSRNHQPHRILVVFTKNDTSKMIENEFCIYSSTNQHSNEYVELTKEYYLKF